MCGIAGVLSETIQAKELESALYDLRSRLVHRGPDDQGVWMNQGQSVGFSHTRLAIQDLTPAGHQPMMSHDGKVVIVFNGEVYNFRELRSDLEQQGIQFHTGSDTEVILALYQRYGKRVVDHLRGMFAFAIWDSLEGTCLLARDPMGIKPLYYTQKGDQLVFASEMQALIHGGFSSRKLNAEAAYSYLIKGSVPEPQTLCEDIHSLSAGHTLVWKRGKISIEEYWKPSFKWHAEPISEHHAPEYIREALLDSLKQHFVSDVPVGLFLSGGIDSTALLALAKASGMNQIRTYSVGVDDAAMDESSAAARTAAHFGSEHHTLNLNGERARDFFGQFLKQQDQPSIDGLNTFSVSCLAHECGLKVVLSGLGGDELFGGYPSFQAIPQIMKIASKARYLGPLRHMIGSALQNQQMPGRLQRFGSFVNSDQTVSQAYQAYRGIYTPEQAMALVKQIAPGAEGSFNVSNIGAYANNDLMDQISVLEISRYMRNQLLRDSDVMSMAWGLELRVPFVDSTLFEKASHVPPSLRLRAGKQMLLDAIPEIPEWVANAPKRGFRFPFQRWMEDSWSDTLSVTNGLLDHGSHSWYQKWAVFALQDWQRRMGVS
jgi:asparagine synthase (glutamine-hydrolysing)